jgi:hypothetical protein
MCFYQDAVKHILSVLPRECTGSLRENIWGLKINYDFLHFVGRASRNDSW